MTALLLANASEVFPTGKPGHGFLWQKALLAAEDEDVILVGPRRPSNAKPPIVGVWPEAVRFVCPEPLDDRLCSDLLSDGAAWQSVSAAAGDRISLRFQVFSPGVASVLERLRSEGVEVEGHLPSCSPSTVAFWNTKVGAHGLLNGIPAVRAARPAATVATYETARAIAASDGSQSFVLKPNYGLGGAGIQILTGSERRKPSPTAVKADISGSDGTEPYLLEVLVGEIDQNRSLTADFSVPPEGEVQFLGMAEQILIDGVSYGGCQSGPDLIEADTRDRVLQLGRSIGVVLQCRGYVGLVNVDFIVTSNADVFVAELNLRQSAPLDQFLISRRLFGEEWASRCSFRCEEEVPVPPESTGLAELAEFARRVIGREDEIRVLPLTFHVEASRPPRASYAAFAPELDQAKWALRTLRKEARKRWP